MTEDDQVLMILRSGTTGITGLMQGCPDGIQTLLGSRISINGNLIPTSQVCSQQARSRAVEMKTGQAPEMVKKAAHSIAECDVSVLQAFGVRMEFTHSDILRVYPGFVTSLAGLSPKQTPVIDENSALRAARRAYSREYGKETTGAADLDSYEIEGNKIEFEVSSPGYHTYDKVTVAVSVDGNTTSASVEFIEE